MRCIKAGNAMAKAVYMIISTSFGYYVMKDRDFLPKALGGNGDYALLFKNHPYAERVPYLREYYYLCASYHFGSLMKHVIGTR